MRRLGQAIRQHTESALGAVRQAFRGKLNLVKSADNIQKVQVSGLADETLQDVELMQQFGLTSVPPAGTQVVVLPMGGETTHSIVIATENGSVRVKNLKSGETAVYDESGSTIILKQGRLIEIDCDILKITATTKVEISSPIVETDHVFTAQGQINGNGGMAIQGGSGASFTGNVTQTKGSFNTDGDVTANGKSLINHTHRGDSGGVTGTLSPPFYSSFHLLCQHGQRNQPAYRGLYKFAYQYTAKCCVYQTDYTFRLMVGKWACRFSAPYYSTGKRLKPCWHVGATICRRGVTAVN